MMGDSYNYNGAWSNQNGYNNQGGHGGNGRYAQQHSQQQMYEEQQSRGPYYAQGNQQHQQQHQQQHYGNYAPQQQHPYDSYGGRGDTFGLNPNAPAFVPRNSSGPSHSSQQQQMNMYPPSYAEAPMYGAAREPPQPMYPNYVHAAPPAMTSFYSECEADQAAYEAMYNQFGNGSNAQQYVPSIDLQYKMADCGNATQLQEIQVGLEQLIDNHDEFESWAGAIRERVAAKNMTDASRQTAVQILVEMAIAVSPTVRQTASPQYLFARLLALLATEVPDLLRENILPVLEVFHGVRSQYELERKCNLIVFFAEVYTRIETDNGSRINALGDAVIEQAIDILKCQTNDTSMKYLVNVVKLAGPELDSTPAGYEKMSELLTRLSGFARGSPQLSESIKTQITMLVEKRQRGWVGSRAAVSSCSSAPTGAIIGADGKEIDLSEEERLFLESHFGVIDGEGIDTDSSIDDTDVLKELGRFEQEERQKKQVDSASELLENLSVSVVEKVVEEKTTEEHQA